MDTTHIGVGTIGLLIGTVGSRYGWNVSGDEAAAWGLLIGGAAALVSKIVTGPGIWPSLYDAWLGHGAWAKKKGAGADDQPG